MSSATRSVALPLRPADELETFHDFMGLGPNFAANRPDGPIYETEVQVLSIGPKQYIGLPGEPFVELGLENTFIVGFANDDPRYILPKTEYENNRYKTWGSMVLPGSGEMLVDAAEQLAKESKPS